VSEAEPPGTQVSGTAPASAPPVAPSTAAVVLRPFGYLLISAIWLVLFAVAAGADLCLFVIPPGPLGARPGFADLDTGNLIAMLLCVFLVLPFAWGLVHLIVLAILGSLLQYLVAFGRSLLPSNRNVKLTGSTRRFDTIGPPGAAVAGVAVSSLSGRQGRFGHWVTRFKTRNWVLNGAWYLGLTCFGYVMFALIYLLRWPVRNPFAMAGVVLFALVFAVLGIRRLRVGWRRLPDADAPPAA